MNDMLIENGILVGKIPIGNTGRRGKKIATYPIYRKRLESVSADTIRVECADEIILITGEKAPLACKINFKDSADPFYVPELEEREVTIVRKPGKMNVFTPNINLAEIITIELNKIEAKWMIKYWRIIPESKAVSALGTMRKKKVEGNIIPLIQKIMEEFYGDEK